MPVLSAGQANFQLRYQIAPIYFIGGIAGTGAANGVPITAYTQSAELAPTIAHPSAFLDPDHYFANYVLEPGSSLFENQISTYPVLNIQVAANAVILQPLRLAMRMICPANSTTTYAHKAAIMGSLIQKINQHILLGGYFNVATPAYIYTGCLLESIIDISPDVGGDNAQVQREYRWSFLQPLISGDVAEKVANERMQAIKNGVQIHSDYPGSQPLANLSGPIPGPSNLASEAGLVDISR